MSEKQPKNPLAPIMKSHREQINEILKKYEIKKLEPHNHLEIIQLYEDEITEIDACINMED